MQCRICGREIEKGALKCVAGGEVCANCCDKCGYKVHAGVCLEICTYATQNLMKRHGVYLAAPCDTEKAVSELSTLDTQTLKQTYEYLRREFQKGITDQCIKKGTMLQLSALQRILESRIICGEKIF